MRSFFRKPIFVAVFCMLVRAHGQCPEQCKCTVRETDCSNQGLDNLPQIIPETTEIFRFNFNNLRTITTLDESYRNVRELEILSNAIADIEDLAFSQLSNLTSLILFGNNMKSLRKKMFSGLNSLVDLDISSNNIVELKSHDFCPGSIPNINRVNLENNKINSIASDVFGKQSNVSEIRLSHNQMSVPPSKQFMASVRFLRKLEINGNPLKTLPDSGFESLGRLEYLNVDSCQVTAIVNKAFAGLESLEELRLGHNLISHISASAFKTLPSLKRLRLHNNRLKTLSLKTLPLDRLTELHLEKNPWHCNCSVVWMHDEIIKSIAPVNITCETSVPLAGKSVFAIDPDDFKCLPPRRNMSLVLAVVIPVVIGLILLLLVSVCCLIKRRQRDDRKAVRYSAVYKETVEKRPQKEDASMPPRPVSEL